MVLMALDHARDYFGDLDLTANLRLATAPPIVYFTRWITHLCAPTFVLLAGTGAFLAAGDVAPPIGRLPVDSRICGSSCWSTRCFIFCGSSNGTRRFSLRK